MKQKQHQGKDLHYTPTVISVTIKTDPPQADVLMSGFKDGDKPTADKALDPAKIVHEIPLHFTGEPVVNAIADLVRGAHIHDVLRDAIASHPEFADATDVAVP